MKTFKIIHSVVVIVAIGLGCWISNNGTASVEEIVATYTIWALVILALMTRFLYEEVLRKKSK